MPAAHLELIVACFNYERIKWDVQISSPIMSVRCGLQPNRIPAPGRQISSFECSVCGTTMESWNTAWSAYRLVAGPTVMKAAPEAQAKG